MKVCPDCGGTLGSKGWSHGKKRYKCKTCKHNFYYKEDNLEQSFTKKEEIAKLEVETSGFNIKSLKELTDYCDIDLNKWVIPKHEIRKRGVILKNKEGEPNERAIFLVSASMFEKLPSKQIFPTIPVMEFPIPTLKLSTTKKKVKKGIVAGDSHNGFSRNLNTGELTPFHSQAIWNSLINLVRNEQPDFIGLLGDMVDFPELQDKFIKLPEFYFTTNESLKSLGMNLAQLRKAAPKAEIIYLEGNHCSRLKRSIVNHYIAGYNLQAYDSLDNVPVLSVEYLLSLKKLNISYYEEEYWLNNNTILKHEFGYKSKSGETSRGLIENTKYNLIFGHIHRQELFSKTEHHRNIPETVSVFTPGVMCHIDGRVPAKNKKNNWQQGLGKIYYTEDELLEIIPIKIVDNKAFHNGVYY